MTSAKPRWVFWDFDGTLVDSMPALHDAYERFLKKFGCRGTRAEFNRLNGPSLPEIVRHLKKTHRLKASEEKLKGFYEGIIRGAYHRKAALKKGAMNALSRFQNAGFRQMLVSSASSSLAGPCLRRRRIAPYFDLTVFGETVKRSKPYPDIYRKALKESASHPARVCVIEDSKSGVRAAQSAGLRVLQVKHGDSLDRIADKVLAPTDEVWPIKTLALRVSGSVRGKGRIFCVRGFRGKDGSVKLTGRFFPYRVRKKHESLAVSGLVSMRQGGRTYYLLGKRSRKVHNYKGRWEFVPSGGVDTSCAGRRGNIDVQKMIFSELQQEAGIARSQTKKARPFLLIRDPKTGVWDICLTIALLGKVRLNFNRAEYSQMRFCSESGTRRWVDGKSTSFVPTSVLMWKYHQRQQGAL